MEEIRQSFQRLFMQIKESAPEILFGFIVFGAFVFIGSIISRGMKKITFSDKISPKKAQLSRRIVRWFFYVVGFTTMLHIMGLTKAASGILAAGGILTVVLGFAFREIGENLLAGFFISFSRSFDVGDLIETDNIRGVVKQINIRDVHVRTSDGIDIFIPSALVFKNPLQNFTRDGLRRGNIVIGIDYRDDSQKARQLILESIETTKGVLKAPAPEVHILNFSANYVELDVLFWINTFSEDSSLSKIRTHVMEMTNHELISNGFTVSSEVSSTIEIKKSSNTKYS